MHDAGCQSALYRVVLKPERWAARALSVYPIAPAPIPARQSLRLWFASFVYVLICALRRLGLAHTRLAEPTCGTIELKLLKIGARVRVSVRRIKVAMASACPYADEFALAHARIRAAARWRRRTRTLPANKRGTLHKLKSPHTRGDCASSSGSGHDTGSWPGQNTA